MTTARVYKSNKHDYILIPLIQYEDLFDGTLGTFPTKPVNLKLKKDTVIMSSQVPQGLPVAKFMRKL